MARNEAIKHLQFLDEKLSHVLTINRYPTPEEIREIFTKLDEVQEWLDMMPAPTDPYAFLAELRPHTLRVIRTELLECKREPEIVAEIAHILVCLDDDE